MFLKEFKRILFDKRFIFIFAAVLIINGILAAANMQPEAELKEFYISQYGEGYKDIIKEFDTGNANYINGYGDFIQSILRNADERLANTDMYKKGSFAERNLIKTKKDFERLNGLQLTAGPETSFNYLCDYNISDFIMIIAAIGSVIVILDERKKGLWELVYSTEHGRKSLALGRSLALAFVSFIIAASVYLENIIAAGLCGNGYGDLTRVIQSMQYCEKVVLRVDVWQFFLIVFVYKFLVLSLITLLFAGMVLLCRGYLKVYFIGGAIILSEYWAYVNIDKFSSYRIFKYINIFAWLDGEWCIRNYQNINIAGYPVSMHTAMFAMVPILTAMAMALVILSGKKRPESMKTGKMRQLIEKLWGSVRIYRHGSLFLSELYKQLFVQKTFILIGAAIFLGVIFYEDNKVSYDYQGTVYNEYVSLLKGKASEEKIAYLEDEYDIWKGKYDEQKALIESGTLSEREEEKALNKQKQYQSAMDTVNELTAEQKRLIKENENGIAAVLVNKYGYNRLIGESGRERKGRDTLIILALGIAAASLLWSSENSGNTGRLIRSTVNGRRRFILCKYLTLFSEGLLLSLPFIISQIKTVYAQYEMVYSGVPVKSLAFYDGLSVVSFFDKIIPGNISVLGAVAFQSIAVIMFVYILMVAATLITYKMKNVMASMAASMAVVLLPVALCYVAFM